MGLFNLSSVKNHPRRSGFDLSSKVAFSAKVGELLPIKWTLTMPGDKFSLKEQHFTRTQPVNTSAYTRVREYYDWFWCPLHLLWRNAPEVIAQIQQNVQHASSFDGSVLLGSNMPCFSADQISKSLDMLTPNPRITGFDCPEPILIVLIPGRRLSVCIRLPFSFRFKKSLFTETKAEVSMLSFPFFLSVTCSSPSR